jgi:hypothetical protein
MTGTTVESAIRVTGRWQTSGPIDSARNQIELLDVPGLQSIAEREELTALSPYGTVDFLRNEASTSAA